MTRDAGFAVAEGPDVEVRRIGVVGCGRIGRMHAGLLAEMPEFVVAGVADAVPAAAEAVSAQSSNDSNVVSLVYSLVYDIDRQRRNTSAQ